MEKLKNYINGELCDPNSGTYLNNYNPSNGEVYSQIPESNSVDIQKAVEAAQNAFPEWSKLPNKVRSKYLLAISEGIKTRFDEFVAAESKDNGKPVKLAAAVDIPRAIDNFSFFATAIKHWSTDTHADGGYLNYTLRKPIGVVGCISPWNLPLYLFSWKIAPALATGNTVVAKPSEVTPYTAYLLSEVCKEVGLPKGVLNIVHGLGAVAGDALVNNIGVKAISFTGSTKTGSHIAKIAADRFAKVSLEMGGKNPNVVFADCDLDKAVSGGVKAAFSNQGQICLCGSRIYVEEGIYEAYKTKFLEKVERLTVGPPTEEVNLGAIVSKDHFNKIINCIELAKSEGGKIIAGGKSVQPNGYENGYYIQPTVIEGLPKGCRTNKEEIFGPVVSIQPFNTEDEAIELANDCDYGLAATVWTENLGRAHRVAEQIESGIVWINCWLVRDLRTPFGGMKDSGVGREGGWEALRFFTEPKNVCLPMD